MPSIKASFPTIVGAGSAVSPGLGGRVGKAFQARHEQMPETLDCRVDHWGRASCRVLMRVQALVFDMCACLGGGVAQTRPGPGVPPDCSLVFSACSACLKDMEILGFYLLGEKD